MQCSLPVDIMDVRFHNYFKAEREKTALTGSDIAFLLNKKYRNWSSPYEAGRTIPSLTVVIGYVLICNTTLSRILRKQVDTIKREVANRIPLLIQTIEEQPNAKKKDARIDYLYYLLNALTNEMV